jgi:hypothetical protein
MDIIRGKRDSKSRIEGRRSLKDLSENEIWICVRVAFIPRRVTSKWNYLYHSQSAAAPNTSFPNHMY